MHAENILFHAQMSTWSPNDTTQMLLFGRLDFCVFVG